MVLQGDNDCDARVKRPHKAQDATKLDVTFMGHSRILSLACTLEGPARTCHCIIRRVSNYSIQNQVKKKLFFFFFFFFLTVGISKHLLESTVLV